jgi:hypothetical protein
MEEEEEESKKKKEKIKIKYLSAAGIQCGRTQLLDGDRIEEQERAEQKPKTKTKKKKKKEEENILFCRVWDVLQLRAHLHTLSLFFFSFLPFFFPQFASYQWGMARAIYKQKHKYKYLYLTERLIDKIGKDRWISG